MSSTDAGSLLFIDEGADKGGYRIVDVLSPTSFTVDRPLTRTTPHVVSSGTGLYGLDGTTNRVSVTTGTLPPVVDDMYISMFGMDWTYQGSYKIKSKGSASVDIEKSPDFPALVARVQPNPGKTLVFTIERGGATREVPIEAESQRDGGRLVFRAGFGPFSIEWHARHYGYIEGVQFCDEQVAGPFRLWRHTHRVVPLGPNESAMEDHIEYVLPGGQLVRWLVGPVFRRLLAVGVAQRHRALRESLRRLGIGVS